MGRGTIRAKSATTSTAKQRWYKQQMDRAKQKVKSNETNTPRYDAKRIQTSALMTSSYRAMKARVTQNGQYKNKTLNAAEGKMRQQALREAKRRGQSPTRAQSYVRKRVGELKQKYWQRNGGKTRSETARIRQQMNQMRGGSNRSQRPTAGAELRDFGTQVRQNSPNRRRSARLARERARGRARWRAAGMRPRSLKSLRRVTPSSPHLRPARRARGSVTPQQRAAASRAARRNANSRISGEMRRGTNPANIYRWQRNNPGRGRNTGGRNRR